MEPIVVTIIAGVSAVVGSIVSPFGQDFVNRRAHERQEAARQAESEREAARAGKDAERQERRDAAERQRARRNELRERLKFIDSAVTGVSGNS